MARGEVGGDSRGKRGKGHEGACMEDTWTGTRRGRIKGGRWGWLGLGRGSGGEKWRQLCLNTIKKCEKINLPIH